MVVVLLLTGNLRYFLKAQVVRIRAVKMKDDMHEILSNTCDVSDPFAFGGDPDHRFRGNERNVADASVLGREMIEELNRVRRFSIEKRLQIFVSHTA